MFVVVGAGVIGLYTAYELAEKYPEKKIHVVAEFLPGDESVDFTSPYAGGNFSCISGSDEDTLKFDKYTYKKLGKLRGQIEGLDYCYSTEYFDQMMNPKKLESLRSYLADFEILKELPKDAVFGIRYRSFSFNCPVFLQDLKKYLELKGVVFERKKLASITEVDSQIVFNCTGIGAFKLGDGNVYPTRGQVLIIRAPHIKENTMRWGKDATYIIKRPQSDQVVLGGFLHDHWWTNATYSEQSEDILRRTSKLVPQVLQNLDIIRTAAGLRPSRRGGPRIEREVLNGKLVIHNYGASGYGYQAGLGMAATAVSLLQESKL